jgi:CRISPR-associated exonuclease Cas4
MMFSEDDLLPLSGLQHLLFCERQWGLIHIEQQWEENRLTAEGRILHDRVHDAGTETRVDLVTARGLALRSLRLGLTGKTDAVEFHRVRDGPPLGTPLAGREGWWQPFPVEYKRGRPKADACDEVQLCAQAICLEEMLGVEIQGGALYYGAERRRKRIEFAVPLRSQTEELARRMHQLYAAGATPPPVYSKKCERCSLIGRCLPAAVSRRDAVKRYLSRALREEETAP